MKGRRRLAVLAALIPVLFGIVLLARMWEPEDVGRYDPVYWLAILQVAKSAPLFEACAAPRYSLERQDGVRPRLSMVRYRTALSRSELIDRYRAAFEDSGCTVDEGDGSLFTGSCAPPFDHAELELTISDREGDTDCIGVSVSVVGG